MGQRKTLGGERLGAGKRQKVDTATFNRSSHDLGYIWRSTMSAGTIVPFMCEVALPADTFDINLGCEVLTLPTLGPLFGSMKVQLDVFTAPVRLYVGALHNNKLGIGLNMASVKLPFLPMPIPYFTPTELEELIDVDNSQINPSSILAYLGVRGLGIQETNVTEYRKINAIPLLAYWDIFKNYYANKQEEEAFVIHTPLQAIVEQVDAVLAGPAGGLTNVELWPLQNGIVLEAGTVFQVNTISLQPAKDIMILFNNGVTEQWVALSELINITTQTATQIQGLFKNGQWGNGAAYSWRYRNATDSPAPEVQLQAFNLEDIDIMREEILSAAMNPAAFDIVNDTGSRQPYSLLTTTVGFQRSIMGSQEGLAVKTYQSDLFNNWLNTEYIDGVGGIAEVTAVSTAGDEFTIDSLILHKKVYDMLNDVLVSGGTYDDWQEVVYDHQSITRAETPIYWGSLIKELQFQEVVSSTASETSSGNQPLGELAGRGRLGNKHKGGNITVKVDEISYLIGLISITPRLDYSQGNEWHINLETMDDFRKPHLDEIGFQELITEQMAWWDTKWTGSTKTTKSAGKQPAWINYMTNVNRVRGNFAIADNSMFMVLTRRYNPEADGDALKIGDLTTYINPTHFNHIFAQTSLDSQNYWVQVGVDMIGRRKMSARVMPNL